MSFVIDFVHNRPHKIKAFFLNKFEFVMRQILSYGGMYFLRMTERLNLFFWRIGECGKAFKISSILFHFMLKCFYTFIVEQSM